MIYDENGKTNNTESTPEEKRAISEINTSQHNNYSYVSNVVKERPTPKNTTTNKENKEE